MDSFIFRRLRPLRSTQLGVLHQRLFRKYKTRQDKTKQNKTKQNKTKQKQDKTRQDKTIQDKTRQDKTRQDTTRQDTARRTRQGRARQKKIRQDRISSNNRTRIKSEVNKGKHWQWGTLKMRLVPRESVKVKCIRYHSFEPFKRLKIRVVVQRVSEWKKTKHNTKPRQDKTRAKTKRDKDRTRQGKKQDKENTKTRQ